MPFTVYTVIYPTTMYQYTVYNWDTHHYDTICGLSHSSAENERIMKSFPTVEWQRKPKMTMARAGVRMVPNTMLATRPLIRAMIMFCAVTSTEQAQQSREPRSSRGSAASYGGGTTTPDPAREGLPRSERPSSDMVFSRVPFRDRLILACVVCCRTENHLQPQTVFWRFSGKSALVVFNSSEMMCVCVCVTVCQVF